MSYVCEFESLCWPTVDISCTPLPIGCLGRFGETGGDMLKDMLDWTGSLTLAEKMTLGEATSAAVVGELGRRVRRPPGVPPGAAVRGYVRNRGAVRDNLSAPV